MSQAVIEFDDVTVSYDRHPAVHHLSGRIDRGSLVALVGPNGAGKTTLLSRIKPEALRLARDALEAVGLAGFAGRAIDSLSAGQFQRVLFARMLVADARLILLDEPFNAIDSRTTLDLIDVIQRWHAEERTIVCVLHDLEIVRAEFPETLLIARSQVAWGPTEMALSPANLSRARSMAEAWHDDAAVCRVPAP